MTAFAPLAAQAESSPSSESSQGYEGVTATWTLGNGTESPMNAELSETGLTSVAAMSLGSGLTAVEPQNIDGMSFYKVQPTVQTSEDTDENALQFTISPKRGLTYKPTNFSMKTARFGTDAGKIDIIASVGGNSVTLAQDITPNRNNSKTTDHYSSYSFDISELSSTGDPVYIKVYVKGLATSRQYGFRDVVVTGNFSGEAENVTTYKLDVGSDTPEAGTITVSPEGTVFDEGTNITISTTENFGYHFAGWTDGEGNLISADNPLAFRIDHDMVVRGVYEKSTVYTLSLNLTNGARRNLVSVEPEGNVVGTTHQYETGTDVRLTAQNNKILTFTGWDYNSTDMTRHITMDGDKDVTANFSSTDYIVGWDLYETNPRNERSADYKSDSENAGLLSLRDSAGNTSSWLSLGEGSGRENGKYAARVWKPLEQKYYFEISFSTRGYENVTVSNDLGISYNSYSVVYEQASTDGSNYITVGTFNMPEQGWAGVQDIQLPDSFSNREKVFVRWMPDFSSALTGSSSDNDGLAIAEIFVLGDNDSTDDNVPPTLVSSNPADGSTGASANGAIVLNFDEKIKAGDGDATLDGEQVAAIISGKSVVYKYSGLAYNTRHTFILPSGAITDRNGNAFGGTTISFTTMERIQPAKRLYDAVVANDGTGDFATIQEAIDAAPENRVSPWLIFVKKGTYAGHVNIPSTKPYMHIVGQGKNLVTIADNRVSGTGSQYALDGATIYIASDNDYLEGFDLQNSYGVEQNDGPQAHALCSNGDKLVMNDIKLRSYQDTWFTGNTMNHRAFITNSWIEGAVDFIFGQGDIMMLNDTINIVRKDGGYIVAPSHPVGTKWGYVFLNNVITAPGNPSETTVWLGRPWHNAPKTVFINTKAEVTIPATGWYDHMNGLPALWAEYNTMDGDGNPVDLSHRRTEYYYTDSEGNRVTGNSQTAVLTAEQAAQYTVKNVSGGDDGWNPELICEPCEAPSVVKENGIITWNDVPYAICYVISKDDTVVGFTTDTEYSVGDNGNYTVQAVNENGGLSKPSLVVSAINTINDKSEDHAVSAIYTIDGKCVSSFVYDVNIVRYADGTTKKVLIRR